MAQARDWHGRFASGGFGGRGPDASGNSSSRTSIKGRTRGETLTDKQTGRQYGSRVYAQRRAVGPDRQVRVQRVYKGGLSNKVPANNYVNRAAVGTRGRVGTPIAGNRNTRFVSRGHAISRAATPAAAAAPARGIGRIHSSRVAGRAISQGAMPRSGYIVSYGRSTPPIAVSGS